MFDQQLTINGGAEDIAPRHEQDRLFNAQKTIRGQLAMSHPFATPFCPNGGRDHEPSEPCEACARFEYGRLARSL